MTPELKNATRLGPLFLVAAGLGLLAWLCAFLVPEDQYALVMRFGAPRSARSRPRVCTSSGPAAGGRRREGRPPDAAPRSRSRTSTSPGTRRTSSSTASSRGPWWTRCLYYKSVSDRAGAEARLDRSLLRAAVGDVLASHDFAHIVSHEAEGE